MKCGSSVTVVSTLGSIPVAGEEILVSEKASCVICRDDMNTVCRPLDLGVIWRPPVIHVIHS